MGGGREGEVSNREKGVDGRKLGKVAREIVVGKVERVCEGRVGKK